MFIKIYEVCTSINEPQLSLIFHRIQLENGETIVTVPVFSFEIIDPSDFDLLLLWHSSSPSREY